MNIIKPSCYMRSNPIKTSELETECLYGESVEVLDNYLEWSYCKLLTDSYCGWVKKNNLGYLGKLSHRIISNRSFLFKGKEVKSGCISYLPLGAQICIKKIQNNWAEVYLFNNKDYEVAYIPKNHIVKLNKKIKDWVGIAEKLIGTPYVWGGRDSIGLDCSALLQLSYQTYGINIPRNTIDQLSINKEVITNLNELERGYVVFWKGHVAIMVNKSNCIHANAHHMETFIEPLTDVINRMGQEYPIIKIMNFN